MNDRELLELAAKAAGLEIDKSPCNGGGRGNTGFDVMGNAVLDWHDMTRWNPLTDDADAFRLAMKLDLKMHHGYTRNSVGPAAFAGDGEQFCIESHEDYADGKCGAMRRAITRYAAEIGKGN